MATAFLTGGTGFLGGHVARALCAAGWSVRLLARDASRLQARDSSSARASLLADLPVAVVAGDLSDEDHLARRLEGVDAIVHVAGLVKARSLADYREVNVEATRRLLRAAARSAPGAVWVHVSSQAAAGPARDGVPVAEGDESRPVSWYGQSKREGEIAVEEGWKGPWTILRPGVIYGPGDRGLFVYFRMAAAGWIPLPAGHSRIQLISADRAALGIARAASRADLSERVGFLCDPEPVRIEDLAREIATLPPRPARVFRVPNAAVRLLGRGETLLETFTRHSRPFNADKAREVLAGDWLCDGIPMARALALPAPRPLGEGLRELWDWYRAAGWLR
ncbi:MAG TPA: NAD-dependent epimerase/dehydratase family protein [Thermoanaerobaculia bacterium]